MKNKGYITIQHWMLELPLSLAETVIYAVIYGFSQDGETKYQGSLSYLAKMAKVSKDTARRALHKMVEAGYIEKFTKEMNGVTFNDYRCNLHTPLAKCEYPPCKMQPHNNIDNIDLNNDKSLSKSNKRFVKPALEEIESYCMEIGSPIDAQAFFDYYESNGWKVGSAGMKDWKATVRNWGRREQKKAEPKPQKESYFQHNNRIMAEIFGEGGKFNG